MVSNNNIYQLAKDVFVSHNKETGVTRLIKFSDTEYFEATLIASEILQLLDGKSPLSEIIKTVCLSFDEGHAPEIKKKGLELIEQLLTEGLIEQVNPSS